MLGGAGDMFGRQDTALEQYVAAGLRQSLRLLRTASSLELRNVQGGEIRGTSQHQVSEFYLSAFGNYESLISNHSQMTDCTFSSVTSERSRARRAAHCGSYLL